RIRLAGDLGLELLPDLSELRLDHRRRYFEVMRRRERVEQLALHLRTGQPGGLLLELRADEFLELIEAFQPERLGEVLVDLGLPFDLDRFDGDVEFGLLSAVLGDGVVLREGRLDDARLAGLGADDAVLEARN